MILFLYGSDSFRSMESLREIKNKFLEKTSSGALPSVVDFEDSVSAAGRQKKDFFELARAGGLFSEKVLLIVKNFLAVSNKEEQESVLEQFKKKGYLIDDKNCVLVFWEKELPKKSQLQGYLLKNAKAKDFAKLEGKQLEKWIMEEMKMNNQDVHFSRLALGKLIAYCGSDTARLATEIKKMSSFREIGEIEEGDVDKLVKAEIDANIFETVEALSSGSKKKALKLLQNQLAQKEDPFYILSMYIYQFRNLLKIGEFFFEGARDKNIIAKSVHLHPFVVQKGIGQLNNFTLSKLKKIYKNLQVIDQEAKTGKIDIKFALDKFVVEM